MRWRGLLFLLALINGPHDVTGIGGTRAGAINLHHNTNKYAESFCQDGVLYRGKKILEYLYNYRGSYVSEMLLK